MDLSLMTLTSLKLLDVPLGLISHPLWQMKVVRTWLERGEYVAVE
jgi:hypothetical protein